MGWVFWVHSRKHTAKLRECTFVRQCVYLCQKHLRSCCSLSSLLWGWSCQRSQYEQHSLYLPPEKDVQSPPLLRPNQWWCLGPLWAILYRLLRLRQELELVPWRVQLWTKWWLWGLENKGVICWQPFKTHFREWKLSFLIKSSPKFVPWCPVHNSLLVQYSHYLNQWWPISPIICRHNKPDEVRTRFTHNNLQKSMEKKLVITP